MLQKIARAVFGSRNDRIVKNLSKRVALINQLEPELQQHSDEQLAAQNVELKQRFEQGETIDDLLN